MPPTDQDKMRALAAELRDISKQYNIKVITAHAPRSPYSGQPPQFEPNEIYIVDYLTRLK